MRSSAERLLEERGSEMNLPDAVITKGLTYQVGKLGVRGSGKKGKKRFTEPGGSVDVIQDKNDRDLSPAALRLAAVLRQLMKILSNILDTRGSLSLMMH